MAKQILGIKLGMTQIFTEDGQVIPVTVVESGNNVVIRNKNVESDGYCAVQVGFGEIKDKHVNKPAKGLFEKAGVKPVKFIREIRLNAESEYKVGDVIGVDVFAAGDKVDATGVSKGKGYQGAVKRHNQRRLKMTHGAGPVHREPGSMGACSSPSRIFPGKGMPGHMGVDTVTVQNLVVVKVDAENNLIAIKGAVPGPKGGVLCITDAVKA